MTRRNAIEFMKGKRWPLIVGLRFTLQRPPEGWIWASAGVGQFPILKHPTLKRPITKSQII